MAEEGTPPPEAELCAELSAMTLKALKKRAKEIGVDEEKIDDADDEDDVKGTVITLILEQMQASAGGADSAAELAAQQQAKQEPQKLREELEGMKLKALKKRAKEIGVDEEKIDDADDEDDVKGTVITLILEQMQASAGGADSAAELAAQQQAKQELQKLREELEGMKLRALKKRAKEIGVDEEKIDDADDEDDVKGTVITLILEQMQASAGGADSAAELAAQQQAKQELQKLREELEGMKLRALKKRAKEIGVDEEKIDDADDEDDVKGTVITLILEQMQASAGGADSAAELAAQQQAKQELQKLREELEGMKLRALKKRAKEIGVDEEKIDDADDEDDVKGTVITLILEQMQASAGGADSAAELAAQQQVKQELQKLREELEGMKLRALKKRAKEIGVDEEKIDDADDEDDVKGTVITLILEQMQASAGGADSAAELAAQQQAKQELQKLREELEGMKLRALKKRAKEIGVDEEKIDDADDADDPKSAVMELIVDRARDGQRSGRVLRPHFAGKKGGGPKLEYLRRLFGSKHCMFSYNWAVQEQVKKIRSEVAAAGVPTWMDIDGGMKADIYDSMAEGVSNAACVVCFMTQAYQDSQNCALELKFAKQSGVPIVAVMMEATDSSGHVWRPGGWLGIITAGILWTPLHDPDSITENIPNLLRQIEQTLAPEETVVEDDGSTIDFSADDARQELERLRKVQCPAVAAKDGGGMCAVPAVVPYLPHGLRITSEMQQLLSSLLTAENKRVGFCGMGGIGKTTIATWVVRDDRTRKQFTQIVWIALGQQPNLEQLQELIYLQLTDQKFEDKTTPTEKQVLLKKAMAGMKLLLVLDDLWEIKHEQHLNFIDDTTESKVLISSRVRGVLQGVEIVDIGLPTEDEAVQMLLSAAGLPPGTSPPEALEVVKFCDCLPLAIGIAGKLMHEMGVTDDWEGVVELLREEFSDTGQECSMEERIIRTSLNAIAGPHRNDILHLFNAFAVTPEDTQLPIEIVVTLFEAESETPLARPPSILKIRRWLKVLIDRSLVLGTVDRPSLHDIVRDYVMSSKPEEARRGMNRRLVELWRSRRPPGGWDIESTESVPQYITRAATHHISGAWKTDWSNDDQALEWLSDFVDGKQDAIPIFAAQVLGVERSAKMAQAAEHAEDWWLASLRWAASAMSQHVLGSYQLSLPVMVESARTLEQVEDNEEKYQLELSVLFKALFSYSRDIDVTGYAGRVLQAVQAMGSAVDTITELRMVHFTEYIPAFFSGDILASNQVAMKLMRISNDARSKVHINDVARRCVLGTYICWASSFVDFSVVEDDPAEVFGSGGCVLTELAQEYDYELMHNDLRYTGPDFVLSFPGGILGPLLYWGDLEAANAAVDRMMPHMVRCLEENNARDVSEFGILKGIQTLWLSILGRRADARKLLHSGHIQDKENFWDWYCEHQTHLRPRGQSPTDDTPGTIQTTEDFLVHNQFLEILVADKAPPASALRQLPEPKVCAKLGVVPAISWGSSAQFIKMVTMVPAMLAHERANSSDGALACAAIILDGERAEGGDGTSCERSLAYSCRGRMLAALGKVEPAEVAFEAACEVAEAGKMPFLAALALRDLCNHVLDGTPRCVEGRKRFEEVASCLACSVDDLDAFVLP